MPPTLKRLIVVTTALAAATAALPRDGHAQAQAPTTVVATGGAQAASQPVAIGQTTFTLRVPLKPNAENVISVTGTDTEGRTAKGDDLRIAQISLTEIVRARVTAQRLTTEEVRQLVAEGTINLADPANYNVSRFVVALVVGGRQVQVPVPVVRRIEEPMGFGESVQIGCAAPGKGISSTERAIFIPCGDGGGNSTPRDIPPIEVVPFEIVPAPGMPGTPGVILIEGRIKTLKEFFRINLLLMNVSSIFTLQDLTARLEVPEGALTGVAPAGGAIVLPDIGPESDTTGQFIIRGDLKGIHKVTAHFGGVITGAFLPAPVPFSGSASTDLEVKGPPKLDVKVTHPDYVTAGVPYELRVEVTNTDPELDALYTSMEIDVGGGADLIDEITGEPKPGATVRTIGDILRGGSTVQTYRVMPRLTGPITSCVGAADANIQLSVLFTGPGRDPRCAIGTLPSERLTTDGRPTVTVVPAHNTVGVAVDPPIVALFSQRMIEPTITSGYPEATLVVQDADGRIVAGTLEFTELFEATAAIFRPAQPLAFGQTYTVIVNPTAFNLDGLSLASGMVARFSTEGAPYVPDTTEPTLSLTLEAPFDAQLVARGQSPVVVVDSADANGVVRVDLLLDGALVDTRRPNSPVRFLLDTAGLEPGTSHVLSAMAHDAAGNVGTTARPLSIAPDDVPPTVTLSADAQVAPGRSVAAVASASDDGRVARVDLFLDNAPAPIDSKLVGPWHFSVPTTGLAAGAHRLVSVATDGAGNAASSQATFVLTSDTTAPLVTVLNPLTPRVRRGSPLAVLASATDDTGVASIAYLLDGAVTPIATGTVGFTLDTALLAAGPHTITVVASDASGNSASAVIALDVFLPDADRDTTAPAPLVTSALIVTTPTGGLVTVTGLDGAAEPGARVVVTNVTTRVERSAVASASGAFALQMEARGDELLRLLVIDEAGNVSAPTTVLVRAAATLTAISVAPAHVALSRSRTSEALLVTGQFSDGRREILTSGLVFASDTPAVASVTSGGLVMPGRNGSAMVTVSVADAGGGQNGPEDDELGGLSVAAVRVPVTVDFASVTSLVASPNPITLGSPGQSQRISVQGRFSDDTIGAFGGVVRFATSDPAVAIVDGAGLVTGTGIGTARVTVSSAGLPTAEVVVVVREVEQTALVLEPATLAFTALAQSQALAVRVRFSNGQVGFPLTAVAFRVLNPLVATVTAQGLVSAAGEGATSIVVESGALVASVPVTVTLPTTTPPPEITQLGRPIAGETDTVVIAGRNFSGVPQGNAVSIGGLPAVVVSAAVDRLVAVVPRGATTGPVQVTVGGQPSNTVDLVVYPRRARTVLESAPFDAPAPGTTQVDLGSVETYVHEGDQMVIVADPDTIGVQGWSGLFGATFQGTLVLVIDGVRHEFAASPAPIDISNLVASAGPPRRVTLQARLEDRGAGLASRGVAVVSGPPGTGAYVGQRFLTGDSNPETVTLRFRVQAPDGALFAATAKPWYRASDGGYSNGSVGGAILGGLPTPNDGDFRTFVASGGEVAVTYSDQGGVLAMGEQATAVVALLPANASGRIGTRPVVDAPVRIGGLDSASVIPDQVTAVADGVARPMDVLINSVRDVNGLAVTSGAHVAMAVRPWYRRVDGGYSNRSAGGTVSGGVPTPNDGDFRTALLAGGEARLAFASAPVVFDATDVGDAVLAVLPAQASGHRVGTRPFAEGRVVLSPGGAGVGSITALPSTLAAAGQDSRAVITITGISDATGRLVPDGTRVAVATRPWYRQGDGGYSNESFGGTILGGDPAPNDGDFRMFTVSGGQVTFTYSNAGLVLGAFETATTVIAILPGSTGGRVGTRPFAEVRIPQGGVTSAVITTDPSSVVADGVRRPVRVRVTGIRDALGNFVPDGTRVALTARPWYRRSDGGYSNGSSGGLLLGGLTAPNDLDFQVYSTIGAALEATYSAESVPLLAATDVRTAVIAATVASATNARVTIRPFAEGAVAVSSVTTGTITASPVSLLADGQPRTSLVTIEGLTDAQGRPVPDGTRVALAARPWYRQSDGGYSNGSAGGSLVGGTPSPNEASFSSYVVSSGRVTATYSAEGLTNAVGATRPAVVSVLPATATGAIIGSRPLLSTVISLVGMDTATVLAPGTGGPGSTVSVTLSNIRDAAGNLVPDGTRVAVTAGNWYTRAGSYGNGSAGGTITGGIATPNDGSLRSFTVSGGQVAFDVVLPGATGRTTVVSVVPADGSGARIGVAPFVTTNIRIE
ncbi:hypothetical protein TBR22_A40590 [Luteitalea sp. TBR-22]|uniref:Ig-like domain-containing protein n=1 Tax=Luteitalea sp. TBR-22 TaxID=2802971 RepID=UPI001AF38A81|nr:Ig-like domain-containing protein [Luteitalea sp. TBR-22]BCS34833.1 hypothetical protein TBR22_A40590 [Luteitalea sp. TBR-22]